MRTCRNTGARLTLVRPLGFQTDSRHLKRAGLDYWEGVNIDYIDDIEVFLENYPHPFYLFTSYAKTNYTDIQYTANDLLIFGSETGGLPEKTKQRYKERCLKIPMVAEGRCLNLATSVGIALYEQIRQTNVLI